VSSSSHPHVTLRCHLKSPSQGKVYLSGGSPDHPVYAGCRLVAAKVNGAIFPGGNRILLRLNGAQEEETRGVVATPATANTARKPGPLARFQNAQAL